MKGLIIKDVMCLKKQLTVFIFVLIGVVAVSIMYVLSAKFGNIALLGLPSERAGLQGGSPARRPQTGFEASLRTLSSHREVS